MKICFRFGFKGKAIAYTHKEILTGFRHSTKCEVVAFSAVHAIEKCFSEAQREACVTDEQMRLAREQINERCERVEISVLQNKNGSCDCNIYWATKDSWENSPKMHNNAGQICDTIYEVLCDIRKLGYKDENPKWLKNITVNKINF